MIDLGFKTETLYAAMHLRVSFGLRNGSAIEGTGTGFIVCRQPSSLFLVTARHVVDPSRAIQKHPGATYLTTQVTGWNFATDAAKQDRLEFTLQGDVLYPADDEIDIAAIPIGTPLEWNRVPVRTFIPMEVLAEGTEFDADVRTGDFIAAPGYAPLPDVETDRPVLLTGIVSSDPRVPVRVTPSGFAAKAVLYQSLSRSGLSGAPVFATRDSTRWRSQRPAPPPYATDRCKCREHLGPSIDAAAVLILHP